MITETVTHRREAEFHNAWASGTPLDDILVRECFEAPTAMENQFILKQMGPLAGKKLLDIGAGLGESSVYFALQGASVTAVDISPQMIETALSLGRKFGVTLEGVVSGAEDLQLPEATYDLIYLANTVHHVQDRESLFAKMSWALKPGGRFFSYDPLAYNPAINVYRRMATKVRTVDEAPLTTADIRLARKYFEGVRHREFWIATLFLFVKYYLFDRIHPNQDRYWKRILRETNKTLWWWRPLKMLDGVLTHLPLVGWLAWNVVIWGQKPTGAKAGVAAQALPTNGHLPPGGTGVTKAGRVVVEMSTKRNVFGNTCPRRQVTTPNHMLSVLKSIIYETLIGFREWLYRCILVFVSYRCEYPRSRI